MTELKANAKLKRFRPPVSAANISELSGNDIRLLSNS